MEKVARHNLAPEPIHDWKHRFLRLDADASQAGDLAAALKLWRQGCNDHALPAWSSYSMPDFRPWIGMVCVNRVQWNPFDALTTLWGTTLVDLYGVDRTGTTLSSSSAERGLTKKDWEFWEKIASEPCIGLASGSLSWKGRGHVVLTLLYLPFGEDGTHCDTIVTVAHR